MKIYDLEQSSPEWLSLRLGKITGSRFKDVLAKGRGNSPSKTRESYILQIVAEILTGEQQESYTNPYMEWGKEHEKNARSCYEVLNNVTVDTVGFVEHDNGRIGVSPDGFVGTDGMTEFKCPKTTTQLQTVLDGEMPSEHMAQIQGQLWICEREWTDFVSYDPRITNGSSFFCTRIHRDGDYIKLLEEECKKFLDEVDVMLEKLN